MHHPHIILDVFRIEFRVPTGLPDSVTAELTRVLGQEGVAAPEDALRLVARKADGGMRDGLSLMDQVLALTGGVVELDAVRRVLGLVEDERYLELLDLLRDARHGDVFDLVERLLDEGYDLVEFYHGLVDVLRGLLRLRLGGGPWDEVSEDLRDAFRERAEAFAPADLVRAIRVQDVARLTKIPGIGKKTAERIGLELKDRLPHVTIEAPGPATPASRPEDQLRDDLLSALVNLGYQAATAQKAIDRTLEATPAAGFEQALRDALRSMMKGA